MHKEKPLISLIAAMDQNRLIGDNNTLPWHLPADFAWFKQVTMGKPIVMGRKTYESIGRPLPGRRNIVLTRNALLDINGCDLVSSLEQAFELTKDDVEVMVIGGANLYQQAIDIADRLYITEVGHSFNGDAWFPQIDARRWQEKSREMHAADDKNQYPHAFVCYHRKVS